MTSRQFSWAALGSDCSREKGECQGLRGEQETARLPITTYIQSIDLFSRCAFNLLFWRTSRLVLCQC